MKARIDAGAVLLIGGAAVAALAIWKAREAAAGAVAAVNPLNENNIANRAANWITQTVTGDKNATVGTAIHAALNPAPAGALSDEFRLVGAVPVHRSAGLTGVRWRVFVGGRWIDGPTPTAAAWMAARPLAPGFADRARRGLPL